MDAFTGKPNPKSPTPEKWVSFHSHSSNDRKIHRSGGKALRLAERLLEHAKANNCEVAISFYEEAVKIANNQNS